MRLTAGVEPLALEMMDQTTLKCVEMHLKSGLPLDVAAMLLIEVDGENDSVSDQMAVVVEECSTSGAVEIRPAGDDAEAQELWKIRRSTSSSFGRMYPNKLGEDISVPRSAIPEMVRRIQQIAQESGLEIPLFGHIGDGNLHPNVLCDLRDSAQMERVVKAAQEIFISAIELGGTLSGEHGIGLLKREFVRMSLDPELVDLMQEIKSSFDPNNILNPGKVLSGTSSESGQRV
jgi:glycolate oxidase